MTDIKPAFDPNQPFQAPPQGSADKPAFDPSKPFEAAPQGSSLGGIAKSLGTGLAQGAIGLAGIPADLAHLYAPNHSDPNPLGSEGLQKAVEGVTGEFHKPQGALEETAAKIGQFAPALIGGPETLATKALTRVAAPAVASEVGGAVAGPVGELAGALAGGAGATAGMRKFQDLVAARNAASVAPTALEAKAASRAGYQHQDVQDVRINPDAVLDLSDRIKADLQHGPNSGFRPANEPKVFSAIDELGTAADQGRSATVADLDNVRQVLGNAAKEKDAIGQPTRQAAAAARAIGHIDKFLPNLQQSDLLAGNAARANSILEEARQNWAAYKKSSGVQTLANNAEINAASAHSGANIGNATRQAFKPLLKNDFAKATGYTDEEKAALDKIVRGTWTGAATRVAGNILGGGGGLGMLASGVTGYESGGVPGALAAGAAGVALKKISNRSTLNAVNKLDALIRMRSPAALKLAAQNPQVAQALPSRSVQALRALITADPTLAQLAQPSNPVGQSYTQ